MTTPVSKFNVVPMDVKIECPHHGIKTIKVPAKDGVPLAAPGPDKCPECREINDVREADSLLRNEVQTNIANAEIPLRFIHARLRDLEGGNIELKSSRVIRRFADNFESHLAAGESLVLHGPTGVGKTHAAVAVMLEIMGRYYKTGRFQTVLDIVRNIRRTWDRDCNVTEDEVIRSLVDPVLLIIDDVGIQYGTENEKLLLFDVINRRYNNLNPMLLTSNLDIDELKAFLGDRTLDRLSEGRGGCLAINGISRRRSA